MSASTTETTPNTSWADNSVPLDSLPPVFDALGTAEGSADASTPSVPLVVGNLYFARVKWFNNTKGYGFVTVLDNNTDLFVHHSQVKPHSECWRTLITGEYVEVTVGEDNRGKQCGHNVTGIQGGQLLCEHMGPYMRSRFHGNNNNNNNSQKQQVYEDTV